MHASRTVKAILFDVDGVVVESELLHMKTFNELIKPLGIHITENEWKKRFLGAGSAMIMTTLFKEHAIPDDPKPWIDRRRVLYQQYVAKGALHPVPGFLQFYQSVRDNHLPLAFISTGHPTNLNAALESLGLKGKHPVIDVTKVTQLKPNPEAYLLGAQTLKVNPLYCLVFEDSPIGVAAAKAAKMMCVALTTTNRAEDLETADLIIPNFESWTLPKIVKTLSDQLANKL